MIIASTGFDDFDKLIETCDKALAAKKDEAAVIYGLTHHDRFGEVYARSRGVEIIKATPERKPLKLFTDALIAFQKAGDESVKRWVAAAENNQLKVKVYEF